MLNGPRVMQSEFLKEKAEIQVFFLNVDSPNFKIGIKCFLKHWMCPKGASLGHCVNISAPEDGVHGLCFYFLSY